MKKAIWIVVILAVVVGGGVFWMIRNKKAKEAAAAKTETKTVTVDTGSIVQNIEANGTVVSRLDVEIKCKASGEITNLPFDVSDVVKKGDLLLELDPTDEDRNVKKAEVSRSNSATKVSRTEADLKVATEELEITKKSVEVSLKTSEIKRDDALAKEARVKELYEKKLASKEEYDTAHTTAVSAQAEYEQAVLNKKNLVNQEGELDLKKKDLKMARADSESNQIDLVIAQQKLKETKISSPIDGTITALNVQVGQIISSGISNVGGGTSIMTVSDLSRLFVLASVDESDIGEVKVDQQVIITADAYPNDTFFGKVVRIAQQGTSTSNVTTFEVKIEVLTENKTLLKPQMTTNVKIILARKDNVLYVPSDAITNGALLASANAALAGGTPPAASGGNKNKNSKNSGLSGMARVAGGKGFNRGMRGSGNYSRGSGSRQSGGFPGGQGAGNFPGGPGGPMVNANGDMPSPPKSTAKRKYYVTLVKDDGTTEDREVQIGITDGENTEITSGLKKGDKVQMKASETSSEWGRGGGPMMMGGPH